MKSSQAAALTLALLLCLAAAPAVLAQDNGGQAAGPPSPPPAQPAVPGPETPAPPTPPSGPSSPASGEFGDTNPFLAGEQTIGLSAGAQIPLFMAPGATDNNSKLLVGGVFGFSYQYFIARGIALGGSLAGAFNGTIGGRSLFVAPLSFRTAYWWAAMPFEFCAAAEAGGYLMRLDTHGMLGPFAKVGGEVLWRISQGWSVGVKGYLWIVPEIHTGSNSSLSRTSGLTEVAMSAVYHL